jgi:putative flippase GtrA
MNWLQTLENFAEKKLGTRLFKLLRYLISGGTAAAVNFATLFVLVQFLHVHYLSASILAFVVSIAVSFAMQKFWTFRDKLTHDIHMQFSRYVVVISSSLLINTVLVYLMVEKLYIWYMFAQVTATIVVAVINFFAYRHFVFEERGWREDTNATA